MPGELTEITELATALGMVSPTIDQAFGTRPAALATVPDAAWMRLAAAWTDGRHQVAFETAFANGQAFLHARDGLRSRPPIRVEWRGPHRPPGDDVVPADLRVDYVYLVSCKYLSKVLLNPGPSRLFERLLVGEARDSTNWFLHTATPAYQAFYAATLDFCGICGLPTDVADADRSQLAGLKDALKGRALPAILQPAWRALCQAVSVESARIWQEKLDTQHSRLRLFWRLIRISGSAYFILGTDATSHLRLRIDSAWDWTQTYDLRQLEVFPRSSGQPEVGWKAHIRRRSDSAEFTVSGHVEIRWSHGRFYGAPESKVYLDSPLGETPGYYPLA